MNSRFKEMYYGKRGHIKGAFIVVVALVLVKYLYNIDAIEYLTTGKPKEILDVAYEYSKRAFSESAELINASAIYLKNLVK